MSAAGSSSRDGQANRRQTQEGDEEEQRGEEKSSAHRTSSSAYQTDQEADRAHLQQRSRRRYNNQSSLFARIRPTPSSLAPLAWQRTAAAVDGEETYARRDAASAALSGFCAAAAAAAATSAIRKSHFSHVVERTDRWRLEREAFRVKVQEHVGRELARMATQAAASLAIVAEAEERRRNLERR
ncbi:unnamed protein product [Ectocarpus sp. 4 AP-2014]